MKSSFQEYKLSTRCEIKSSKRVFAKEYITNGIPFVRSKDVIDKSLGIFKNYDLFISHERFRELKRLTGSPEKGDILLSSVGNRSGKCYVVNDEGDFYFKDGNIIWISKFDEIDSYYLSYFFNSDLGQRKLQSVMIGSAQKALTIDSIRNLRINLPNLQIQKGIANVLRTLDKKIELNKESNKNLEKIAQAIFKSWFIDFDPVKAKAEGRSTGLPDEISDLFPNSFEDSELGEIPSGWQFCLSSDLYKVTIGKTPPRKESVWFSKSKNDIPWISIKDMGNSFVFALETSEFLTEDAVNQFNVKVVPAGTVIVSFKLTVGRILITPIDMVTNEAIAHFLPLHNPIPSSYSFCLFSNFDYRSLGSTSSIATAVNSKTLREMKILDPPYEFIKAFDQICKPIFEKIKTNLNESESLEQIKNTLLPKLISGELRIPDAEKMIEEAGI